jgi:hypothetical protein
MRFGIVGADLGAVGRVTFFDVVGDGVDGYDRGFDGVEGVEEVGRVGRGDDSTVVFSAGSGVFAKTINIRESRRMTLFNIVLDFNDEIMFLMI